MMLYVFQSGEKESQWSGLKLVKDGCTIDFIMRCG
jgi:hypothetical protein